MIYGHCLVTLPCTVNETLIWFTSLAYLNAAIILVVTVQRLDISSLSPPTVDITYVNPTLNKINNYRHAKYECNSLNVDQDITR